jgi:putative oxidoreductase
MASLLERYASYAPKALALLRIVAAFMFIQTGTLKLFAFPIGMPPDNGTAAAFTQIWFAGVLETFGGLLLMIGLFTRPVAFLLSGTMAVAYFQGHAMLSFWTVENGGMAAALYCFLWLYYSMAGAGEWSVDSIILGKK